MRTLSICFLMLLSILSFGQERDTALVRMEVDSLLSLNKPFILQGAFPEALNALEAANTIYLSVFDKNDILYASILFNKAIYHHFQGQFPEAKELYLETEQIQSKTIGKKHPDYAYTLSNLASLYLQTGAIEKAEKMLLESKEIRENTLGNQSPEYAATLNNLASLYLQTRDYRKAESMFLEVKDIRKKTLGEDHYEYGGIINNLGAFYYETLSFEKAESMYLESISIKEKALGENAPDVAISKGNLAIMYSEIGAYQKAEKLLLEVRKIQAATIGKNHPDYSYTLNNMGNMYFRIGDYEKAESMYLESKEIWENTTDEVNPDYANILNNLAGVYYKIGAYDKAEKMYLQVKDIRADIQGTDHPLYGDVISNLGAVYYEKESNEKAEEMYLLAKEIRKNALGEENAPYAESVGELGSFYAKMGNLGKAEKMYLDAIGIYEKLEQPNLSQYFTALEYLAALYKKKEMYVKAENFYLKSKEKRAQVLGKTHPDYAFSLKNLALFYQLTDNPTAAIPLFLECIEIEKKLFLRAARHLSESELFIYSERFVNTQYLLNSFAESNPELAGVAYDNNLFYKGFVLNAIQKIRKSARNTEKSLDLYNSLSGYSRLLASEYAKPIAERTNLEKLEEEANLLEKELIREVADYEQIPQQVTWQNVQDELSADAASVEFIRYQKYKPSLTDGVMYAAVVLRANAEQPELIPLFSEKQLKDLMGRQGETTDLVNNLYSLQTEDGILLKNLIYKPLEKVLQNINTIYYAPSGQLHRLNLAAIQLDQSTTLGDRFQLIQLGSTRQLMTKKDTKKVQNNTAALFGAIEYEANLKEENSGKIEPILVESEEEQTITEENTIGVTLRRSPTAPIYFSKVDSTLRGGKWNYLKWTEVEIGAIELILEDANMEITVKKGSSASEEAFKDLGRNEPPPKILHLATHGFFFPDPSTDNRLLGGSDEAPIFKISEHPMIRSGLILAGGNYTWTTGQPMESGQEDGILTAYEISQMNLSNTELVVLSACETGLGDIKGNEGVYGLQRAFKIAGAKYLIMSLWQVPDYQTQELMTTFYVNWLEEKMEIPQAFRAAQQALKKRYPEPFSWAGFVLVE